MRRLGACVTALALAIFGAAHAVAEDFETLRVVSATPLPGMMAGPGDTALLLSPEGGTLLHLTGREGCLYDLVGGGPRLLRCAALNDKAPGVEGLSWSPDGSRVIWPNWNTALMHFRDIDVEVLDLATMEVSALTDDGVDGSLSGSTAPLDLAAGWMDPETVLFVRMTLPADGSKARQPASLLSARLDGTTTELLPRIGEGGWVSPLAVAPDGKTIAIYLDDREQPEASGLFLHRIGEAAPRRLAPATTFAVPPRALSFSADGRFLVATAPGPGGVEATLVEAATGSAVPFQPRERLAAVGWSPMGSALAYIAGSDPGSGTTGGLFLSEPPGAPGRLLQSGDFMAPLCCTQLLTWARNDTILLGNAESFDEPVLLRFVR